MNKIAVISLSALGGTALFAVSFLGFAKINGVPLHSLPAVGGMFPPEAGATEEDGHSSLPPADAGNPAEAHGTTPEVAAGTHDGGQAPESPTKVFDPAHPDADSHGLVSQVPERPTELTRGREVHAGIFDMLDADSLYTQAELRALADSLRAKNREVEQRGAELERREDLLADRLTALEERRHTIDEFAKQLDARDRELKAREAETRRDEKIAGSGEGAKVPTGDLSAFFTDGETEVLIGRLAAFTPEEAAQILVRLTPARAKELIDALPSARWREFAEAYARAAQTAPAN